MKKKTIILSILSLFSSALLVLFPILSNNIVDEALDQNKDKVIIYIIIISIILALLILTNTLINFLTYKFYNKEEYLLKNKLYDDLIKDDIVNLNNYKSAEIEQLFTKDVSNIISLNLITIPNCIRQISRLILAISLIIYMVIIKELSFYVLIMIFVIGILLLPFGRIYSKIIKPHHKNVLEKSGKLNSYLVESKDLIHLIKADNSYEYSANYYNELNNNYLKEKNNRDFIFNITHSAIYALSNIIFVLIIILSSYFISKGELKYGVMVFLILILNNVQYPLLSFSSILNQYNESKASKERIKEILNKNIEIENKEIKDFNKIIFDNVSFKYENKDVINNLSFEINKGDIILLKGPSGIGKTTIFNLLLGFLKPIEGNIYIETNENKININKDTRNLFSYVPQENILFSASILDNFYILTGVKDIDKIKEALTLANVLDEIDDLNISTKKLSLGQIQRILIAIAIIKNNEIYLLDEFSSAIDNKNEEIIFNNLKKLNKTIIYISHKNNNLTDKIIEIK